MIVLKNTTFRRRKVLLVRFPLELIAQRSMVRTFNPIAHGYFTFLPSEKLLQTFPLSPTTGAHPLSYRTREPAADTIIPPYSLFRSCFRKSLVFSHLKFHNFIETESKIRKKDSNLHRAFAPDFKER